MTSHVGILIFRCIAVLSTVLTGALANGQATLNIHGTEGFLSVTFYLLSDIDSLTYSYGSSPSMTIHMVDGDDQTYLLSEFDSLTYSPGGVEGTPLAATLSPLLVQVFSAVVTGHCEPPPSGGGPNYNGYCYGTEPEPTIGPGTTSTPFLGAGSTYVQLNGLIPGATYYMRAFAQNDVGTAYGNQVSFTTIATGEPVTDVDGNSYQTIQIGGQRWFMENLRTTKYRNGDPIPTGHSNAQWEALSSGAYAINVGFTDVEDISSVYGNLYNYFAVSDTRGLCPLGWHVPSDADWIVLEMALGMSSVQAYSTGLRTEGDVGGKLKLAGENSHWTDPNSWATNSSGFSGLPSGNRDYSGLMNYIGLNGLDPLGQGWWWSSTSVNTYYRWYRMVDYGTGGVHRGYLERRWGLCVRCIED